MIMPCSVNSSPPGEPSEVFVHVSDSVCIGSHIDSLNMISQNVALIIFILLTIPSQMCDETA